MGHMGPKGKEEGAARTGRAPPPPLVRIGQGRGGGGGAPLFPFPLPPSFSYKARERSPTPGGSRTPPGAPLGGRPGLPLPSFIYGGRGAPQNTQVDHCDRSLAVCGAPPPPYSTSVISLQCLGEALRR